MKGDSYIDHDDVLEHTLQRERERKTQRREEREFHASANMLGHTGELCKCWQMINVSKQKTTKFLIEQN